MQATQQNSTDEYVWVLPSRAPDSLRRNQVNLIVTYLKECQMTRPSHAFSSCSLVKQKAPRCTVFLTGLLINVVWAVLGQHRVWLISPVKGRATLPSHAGLYRCHHFLLLMACPTPLEWSESSASHRAARSTPLGRWTVTSPGLQGCLCHTPAKSTRQRWHLNLPPSPTIWQLFL